MKLGRIDVLRLRVPLCCRLGRELLADRIESSGKLVDGAQARRELIDTCLHSGVAGLAVGEPVLESVETRPELGDRVGRLRLLHRIEPGAQLRELRLGAGDLLERTRELLHATGECGIVCGAGGKLLDLLAQGRDLRVVGGGVQPAAQLLELRLRAGDLLEGTRELLHTTRECGIVCGAGGKLLDLLAQGCDLRVVGRRRPAGHAALRAGTWWR